MPSLGPRLVVAGTTSGVGKTSVAVGLMGALQRRGHRVGAAKVGPDYIDPSFHAMAIGRPGRNLDPWLCGQDAIAPLAAKASDGCDVLLVEGVMGLFDGAADGTAASTADVARLLGAPVLLVVDASSMSGSVAALVHGFATLDPGTRLAGVILNRVGSDAHESMLLGALAPLSVPVVGVLRRDEQLRWPSRHLGLVPAGERREDSRRTVELLATAVADGCDLDTVWAIAASAPARMVAEPPAATPPDRSAPPTAIAVASGPAFDFVYADNLELLAEAGAELVPFNPISDATLPDSAAGLYAAGGFPEVFAEALADNRPLLADVRRRVTRGLVTWAECGGLLWLCQSLDGHEMAGVIPATARMTERLSLGYRRARVQTDTPIAPAGTELRGHEFHYSTVSPPGEALELASPFATRPDGFASSSLLASYLHLHLMSDPRLATSFVACAQRGAVTAGQAG